MSEEADKFYSFITNVDGTGLIDEVNAGKRKLNFEIDTTDKSGNVIEVTNTGSMYLVETYGSYAGLVMIKYLVQNKQVLLLQEHYNLLQVFL